MFQRLVLVPGTSTRQGPTTQMTLLACSTLLSIHIKCFFWPAYFFLFGGSISQQHMTKSPPAYLSPEKMTHSLSCLGFDSLGLAVTTETKWHTTKVAGGLTPIAYLSPEKQNNTHMTDQAFHQKQMSPCSSQLFLFPLSCSLAGFSCCLSSSEDMLTEHICTKDWLYRSFYGQQCSRRFYPIKTFFQDLFIQ